MSGALSVMTAYNSFDGTPCTSNNWLLKKKLKDEWKFRGFVISDASATGGANVLHMTAGGYEEAGQQAIENGLDVIFQTDLDHFELFKRPFLDGTVSESIVDSAVLRVLKAKKELGLFINPFADPVKADSTNGCEPHRELALEAARKSIVLLKNEDGCLPLRSTIRSVAVIGTDATEARLGGYSGPGNRKISILDGIKMIANDSITVSYSPGCGRFSSLLPVVPPEYLRHVKEGRMQPGLEAAYFSNANLEGAPVLSRIDSQVDFSWTLYGPGQELPNSWYSVRWTGYIMPEAEGTCRIGIRGNDGFRLYLNDQLILDKWTKQTSGTFLAEYHFNSLDPCKLRLEYRDCTGNSHLELIWDREMADTADIAIARAVEVARRSEAIICSVGIEEGEFRDRASLDLPGSQEKMIRALAETGRPLIVLFTGGSAVTMNNWINEVPAILDAWYPGEAGGLAVAEVLFGKYNPAGRLPITFPAAVAQLPLVYNHKPTGRGDDYLDLSGEPLFPFGFGLSYTGFRYADLQIRPDRIEAGDSVAVTFMLTNTGATWGEEVWQLYLRDELASVARPVRELKGFGRVMLKPGESRHILWKLAPDDFSMLNRNLVKVIEPGDFSILVGSSSKDIRLKGILKVNEPK
jgi:beta-glucosidase